MDNVIDLTYLESIADDDDSIVIELVNIFDEQIEEFTGGFKEHFNNKNWKNLAALAHKAKSSVVSMGMTELGEQDLKNLELICKVLIIDELEKKENINPKDTEDIKNAKMSISSFSQDRQTWIKDHATHEMIAYIIEKFTNICQQAKSDIHNYLKTKQQ